ncbi:MAG: hypothetical protein OEY85_10865 [Rhodospirillales bacterium]|nr:hypothetical protein [Rhodospirillales bacterium]
MNASLERVNLDSLHSLPLSILPVQTPILKTARLIKNTHLESVVEFFDDVATGSGQVDIEGLHGTCGWPVNSVPQDLILLRRLGRLPSYDVYSLRIALRTMGIPVNNIESLKLSATKVLELTDYMTSFTHPLIRQIYGGEDIAVQKFEDIISLFKSPDVEIARDKLRIMAKTLGISLSEIPKFLEDYGDVFLSLSYFRQCLDQIHPVMESLLESLYDIRSNRQLSQDTSLMRACDMVENTFNNLMMAVSGRFENFDRSTKDMWDNISAERFRQVEDLITRYHITIGGALCALSVKMAAWHKLFPTAETGGIVKRSQIIMSDIKPGIENIRMIEDNAPMLAQLAKEDEDFNPVEALSTVDS